MSPHHDPEQEPYEQGRHEQHERDEQDSLRTE
jgi:hypothetical protein